MKKNKPASASKPSPPRPQESRPAAAPSLPHVTEESANAPFFSRIDWGAFWVAFVISLGVYVYTLAPTVTLEDSGELATAGAYLGVPHPPGYPIWTVLVWTFTKIFSFVRYWGQPNPAWSIGLASAVFGAFAAGLTAMLICRSGRDMLRSIRATTEIIGESTEGLICWAGGVSGSLVLAFSPVIWSQSVIVEVYSLNAFFLVLILLLAYMWMRRPSDRLLVVTGFMFGLGMTNYQVLLLLAFSLAVVVFVRDTALFRDFFIAGLPFAIVAGLIKFGKLPPIIHPTHVTCFLYLTLNFLVLALTYFFLPRGKAVALTILAAELGLAVYGFMPIASEFNPPMNWGYPRTWEGFKHALTRGQYEKIVATDIFSPRFVEVIGFYLKDLRATFTLPIAIAGFLSFSVWAVDVSGRRFRALSAAVALAIAATVLIVAEEVIPANISEALMLATLYRLMVFGILLLLIVGGFALVINEVAEMLAKVAGRMSTTLSERVTIVMALAGGLGAVAWYVFMLFKRLVEPGSMIENITILALIAAPMALAALISWMMFGRPKMELEYDRPTQKWLVGTLAGFTVMSLVLIVLADPKGDLQDSFIQRVKFISSHALFSFWVGYGVLFGLSFVDTFTRGNKIIQWVGVIGVALAVPLIPLYENGFNKELIRASGGAEQNGHDFGWQFGNYQLRGAHAVTEELSPDEEPLPNPEFPVEMGYGAVFFGGTDPGRFVPTYMIYSARVREDVYLITQNALADNTYMSVMRDLYGDLIWIPSVRDGNSAFQKYVEDVQAGRMPASAEIVIENGRVSVQGVGGVMLINGILAKMIFDYNKATHDFYVEESYVIQWMYPYLEPHGLIMKINSEPMPGLTVEMINNDLDFWDWYTRRLIANPKFVRDVVARKSFSKLRSALAGVYMFRGLFEQAERAFQEAIQLYPLSPEASFRLADLYLRWGRIADGCSVMRKFIEQDPGNGRARDFLRDIESRDKLFQRKNQIEAEISKTQTPNVVLALELADIYRQLGDEQRFMAIAVSILNSPNMPAPVLARLGQMFMEARKLEQVEQALEKYTEQVPADMNVWLDLATVRLGLKKPPDSVLKAINQAVKIGGDAAVDILKKDKRFDLIRNAPAFKQIVSRKF